MSGFLNLSLETGPGSYEIQDSIGKLSMKHYNSPRAIIAKAKKSNKLFISPELNKHLSGLESPGVNTYNPDHLKILDKSPSTVFGTEVRNMSHITAMLDRSPGPVYSNLIPVKNSGITFAKSRRSSSIEPISPAPWDYNPKFQRNRLPDIVFRETNERNEDKYLTPGPGSYEARDYSNKRNAYVSKVGRNVMKLRDPSPGPGSYDMGSKKIKSIAKFSGGRRDLDPRSYAKSYELYKQY